jgi:hypothetical protein
MECAADIVADDVTDGEIGADMRAEGAGDASDTVLTAKDYDATIEKAVALDLALVDVR